MIHTKVTMHYVIYLFLVCLSCSTAALSAATGMGGGLIFLIGINLYIPMGTCIPVHGLIQAVNNVIRVWGLRGHLSYKMNLYFTIGAIIGVCSIFNVMSEIEIRKLSYVLISILCLYTLLKPQKMPELKLGYKGFFFLGLVTGVIGMLVGAVDPLLSPFFLRDDFDRHHVVANKSYFQLVIHLLKIPFFILLGFNYGDKLDLTLLLLISGVIGSYLGLNLLNKIDNFLFKRIYKVILVIVLFRLFYKIYE